MESTEVTMWTMPEDTKKTLTEPEDIQKILTEITTTHPELQTVIDDILRAPDETSVMKLFIAVYNNGYLKGYETGYEDYFY